MSGTGFDTKTPGGAEGAGEFIPNPGILINALVLQEAKLSSEIENVVTTNDELYRHCLRAYVRETNIL